MQHQPNRSSWLQRCGFNRFDLTELVVVLAVFAVVAFSCTPTFAGGPAPSVWLKLPPVSGECYAINLPITPGQAQLFRKGDSRPLAALRTNGKWQLMPLAERHEINTLQRQGKAEILIEAVMLCGKDGSFDRLYNVWWWRPIS